MLLPMTTNTLSVLDYLYNFSSNDQHTREDILKLITSLKNTELSSTKNTEINIVKRLTIDQVRPVCFKQNISARLCFHCGELIYKDEWHFYSSPKKDNVNYYDKNYWYNWHEQCATEKHKEHPFYIKYLKEKK
jgi:hypothetical protein